MLPPFPSKPERILLKISGENFGTGEPFQLSKVQYILDEITQIHHSGVEIAIVMGAGNIIRGATLEREGISRTAGDAMGMLATVLNALLLSQLLEKKKIETRIMTARPVEGIGEIYHTEKSREYLSQKKVVLFAGGIGHPYFTTDTAAALRAVEIGAQKLLKGTKVDGVYSGVDIENSQKFDELSYQQVIDNKYRIMDLTAIVFCMENKIPIQVFNLMKPGNLLNAVSGEKTGTIIR